MKAILLSLCMLLLAEKTASAQKVLSPEEISKLTPEKIKGFSQVEDSKSSLIKMGDLRYSFCERKFSKANQKIVILLFDYKEAPIMYKQAMRRWTTPNIVTDSLVFRNITKENYTGWESYNRLSSSTQIFIGINERFFLMISGEKMELGKLQDVLAAISFESYPY